jgi:hypothetical protein
MLSQMAKPSAEETLRELARLLAPYVAEALKGQESPTARSDGRGRRYDGEGARDFVASLGREVTEHAMVFFEALSKPPNRIDAGTLADQLGALSGRSLSGMLTTPLKRHADRLGFDRPPWDELDRSGRDPTVWADRDGNAARIYQALARHWAAHPHWSPRVKDLLTNPETRRPAPSSIYVWAPEYVEELHGRDGKESGSSCLRTDGPGTRAVIYRAHEQQGIVALFDIGETPTPDEDWGYYARGHVHLLADPITRGELLEHPNLARVFGPIQGRRRIPASAQRPLAELLQRRFDRGELPVFLPLDDRGATHGTAANRLRK